MNLLLSLLWELKEMFFKHPVIFPSVNEIMY